jgi:CRISPR-associated endonuclease Csn1
VDAYKDEEEWTVIQPDFSFLFSVYGHSYIEITKSDGELVRGYFKGLHRGTGAVSLADHNNLLSLRTGLGARTLLALRKFQVDRLGRRFEIRSEVRTWRGAACT